MTWARGTDAEDVLDPPLADTALAADGLEEIAAALDDDAVYAAVLRLDGPPDDVSFDVVVASLAAGWDAGGFATGFVDGEAYVSTVLWHGSDDDAEANASALPDMMAAHAGCVDGAEVDVDVEGPLVSASCPVDEAEWEMSILSRDLAFPPLFGSAANG